MKVLYNVQERSYSGNDMRIVEYEGEESKWKFGVESRPIVSTSMAHVYAEIEPWNVMGGGVGYNESVFATYTEAWAFLDKGLKKEEENPDIWLEMLECRKK